MKFTSSRWVNRILLGLVVLIALFFALQFADHLLSRKYEAEEAKQREERQRRIEIKSRWIRIQPRQGGFSVLMPNRPTLVTNSVKGPTGPLDLLQWISIDYINRSEKNAYAVSFAELPRDVTLNDRETIYERARAEFLKKMGTVVDVRPVMLQGITGQESQLTSRDGTNMLVMRAFFVEWRFYQAIAIVPISRGTTTNTWRFLDSFRFITNSLAE